MPIEVDGKLYKYCLLDTNIVSEIVKNKNSEGRYFFLKIIKDNWLPLITVDTIIELRRNVEIYNKFLDFIDNSFFARTKTLEEIFLEEKDNYYNQDEIKPFEYVMTSKKLDPNGVYFPEFFDELFKNKDVLHTENIWRTNEKHVLKTWNSQIDNFEISKDVPNAKDAERYIEEAFIQTIIKLDLSYKSNWVVNLLKDKNELIDKNRFPSILLLLYSQYYRIYDPNWKPNPQEVTDLKIISSAPYVDIVIVESFQAEIMKKVKKRIPHMENLEIYTIRDLRKNFS